MANNLRYELKLDISAVIDNLKKTEDRLKQVFGKLQEPVSLDIDSSEAEEALDNINSVDVAISADASDAIASANDTEAQINKIPDSKEINIKADTENAMTGLAKLGLGLNALTSVYGMLNSSLSSFLNLSNTQEKAENDLISALQTKGQATQENIKSYNEFASAMQKVTTTGDEQTLKLLTMSVNMGIAEEKRKEATQGALGLAKAFESAGLTQETALKGIALAYEGEYAQLSRYIPALRTAQTEAEKMAILQEAMANGFKMAQDETKTGAGAIQQYQNLVGDLKEKIGDLIKSAILPVISVLTSFASLLNDHPGIFKTAVAAIGSLVVALSAWKVAQIALNLSLTMNPIGLVIVAIGALVAGIAVAINHVGGFAQAWEFVKASLLITWEYMKAFTNALAGMVDIIKNTFSKIKDMLKALFTGDFQGFINIVTNGFTTAFTQSMDRFADAGKKAKDIWEEAGKTAEKAMNPTTWNPDGSSGHWNSDGSSGHVILSDSEESPQQDPIIAAYQKELELLNLKRQNNYKVTEELKTVYAEYMQYLLNLYGKDSIEYQQVLNQKINFERDRALKLANIERERLAEERAMQQAAWDFEQEKLLMEDPHQARLNQQIRHIEQFYEKRSELLIKQGYTEEQITAQKNKAIEALELDSMLNRMKSHGQGLGQMANNMAQFGTLGFNASKALQKAQVIMETPAAAMSAYRAVVGIPIIGPTLAPIAFAAAIATGLRQLSAIDKAKPPKAKMGGLSGLLRGNSHENGGILIEAEGDEYIINKNRVKELGKGFFDFLNFSPLSAVKSAIETGRALSVRLPSVPAPSAVMANGGAIVHRQSLADNNDNPLILKFNETVEQLKELKQALLDKEMTVHNHISANEIIKKADPATLNEQNEKGELIRSRW